MSGLVRLRVGVSGYCTSPEALVFRGGSWRRLQFPCSWALLDHPQWGLVLFDTGYSHRFFEATRPLPERLYRWATPVHLPPGGSALEQLQTWGYSAADVKLVVLSHLHGDHVAGLRDFPSAAILAHPDAFPAYRTLGRFAQVKAAYLRGLLPDEAERRLVPWTLQGRFSEVDGLTLVDLPGHAPGHLGLLCATASGPVLLGADAAWSMAELEGTSLVHPVAARVLHDPAAYRATQAWLRVYLSENPSTTLLLSHGREVLEWEERGWV